MARTFAAKEIVKDNCDHPFRWLKVEYGELSVLSRKMTGLA